jgi:GT2 family glycosyltransferase
VTTTASPVAVVVVNWNQRAMTLECLDSLARVTAPRVRVILVDNGSTDGSAAAVREAFPQVDVIETGRNLLFAGGNNAGIRHALALDISLVALLNNDTLVDPGFLEPLAEALEGDPRCGMVSPKIFYADHPATLWYAGGEISFWKGEIKHRGIRALDGEEFNVGGETGYATGCCLMTRRDVLDRVGLLDESFRMYGEDVDWSMRVREAGWTVRYEPRSRIWHRVSASVGGHLSWSKMRRKGVSTLRFFARHVPWYQLPVVAVTAPVSAAWAATRYLLTTRR